MSESLRERMSEAFANFFVGQKTVGKIVDIHRDNHRGDLYHLLIETEGGERREIIEFEETTFFSPDFGFQTIKLFDRIKLGDQYDVRTRGKGFVPLLSGKIEHDPFHLKE